MATYALTPVITDQQYLATYSFTGGSAATALADQTGAVDTRTFGGLWSSIIVTSQVVKAGTTDTATITLQGSEDGTNWFSLADISNSPNDATNTSPSTASTHNLFASYVISPTATYGTPRFRYYRASYTTSGSTDNKSIINGNIKLLR